MTTDATPSHLPSQAPPLHSPSLAHLASILKEEPSLLIEGLQESPKSLILHELFKATHQNILVITSEPRESKILDDAPFFDLSPLLEFPSWEMLPGDDIPPSLDIIGKRFHALYTLLQAKKPLILLAPLQAAVQKLPPLGALEPLLHEWKIGSEIPFSTLPTLLSSLGYERSHVVSDKGEFALRGGILDLFPVSALHPYRLDFFGDTIDSIRTFDPTSQKTTGKVDHLFLAPASELPLLKEHKKLATLFDYVGIEATVVFDDLLKLEDKYVALKKLPGSHSSLFLTFSDLLREAELRKTLFWTQEAAEELSETEHIKRVGRDYHSGKTPLQPLKFEIGETKIETKRWRHPFLPLDLGRLPSKPYVICPTEIEERAALEKTPTAIPLRGHLSSGFTLQDSPVALIPISEITGRKATLRREGWRSAHHTPASEFHELTSGDLVVHFHNGIGKFLGIEKQKNHQGIEAEFLVLEYAEKSKLFVPMAQAYLVSRYIGAHEEIPTLHTLGTKAWHNTKIKAQQAILGYAEELLRLSAQRELKGGFAFPEDSGELKQFEADFPYVETDDQNRAILAIKQDMMSSKAMDRLVCGDVGYGKTEVAMRAAFKAVVDGKKQVALLVPTTVLALQHAESFASRMANYPIVVRAVSRFHTPKEVRETLELAREGKVDILIGTHRLISKDVAFKDLGLIIIDEEQRFGVRAKEHLKALTVGVDSLTLTATPIPRTLYFSLVGAREISVINTPPQDRLPIKTILAEKDPDLVRGALIRELSRDGQAFFIHNRVESLPLVQEEIQKLVPEARIVACHGQMSSDELDLVFHTFKRGDADILIATTLIENGIDIPNANTILIDRADHFGLADLYQLRGRVGRWNRPAYAYFLTPKGKTLPEIPRKRLNAMIEAGGRGGGMKLAMRDLEIRGSGDLLGTKQSGHVASIGFHLYCKLLKKTIDALKREKSPTFIETKMEFSYDAKLPESYIGETQIRLELYHRLGEATTTLEIDALLSEMKDRFGKPPAPVIWLYHLMRIKVVASEKRYTLLKFGAHTLYTEQVGKETQKKSFPLPLITKPEYLEKFVLPVL